MASTGVYTGLINIAMYWSHPDRRVARWPKVRSAPPSACLPVLMSGLVLMVGDWLPSLQWSAMMLGVYLAVAERKSFSRSMPRANAEDPHRSEGI